MATAKNGENFDIQEDLRINKREYINDIKKYSVRDWMIYEYEYNQDGKYIKFFYLTKLNVIVLVTYNCDERHFNKNELDEAITIIKTIKVISKN